MSYNLPAWQNEPSITSPLGAGNLLLLNNAINHLDGRVGTVEASGPNIGNEGDLVQHVGVPLYIYPDWYTSPPRVWDQINDNAPSVRYVIVNPDTGPGSSQNSDYLRQIRLAQASGVRVLGYVSTSYGSVPQATAIADAQKWVDWYNVNGLFLDETNYNSNHSHYLTIYNAIKSIDSGLTVVANPGLGVVEEMNDTADIFMSFEGTPTDYRLRATVNAPAWERLAPASKQWHLVHSVASLAEAQEMLDLSRTYRAGTVFITDRTMPNPWLGLPTISGIWEAQLARTRPPNIVAGQQGLSGCRFVGRKTSTGAPSSGTWQVGDLAIDSAGAWHLCTAAGTPGTWT